MFLGPEGIVLETFLFLSYNFFYGISFCRFSNFKNLSSPELALFQGVSKKKLYSQSCDRRFCGSSYILKFSKLFFFDQF